MKDVCNLSSNTLKVFFKNLNKLRFMILIDYSTQYSKDVNSLEINL